MTLLHIWTKQCDVQHSTVTLSLRENQIPPRGQISFTGTRAKLHSSPWLLLPLDFPVQVAKPTYRGLLPQHGGPCWGPYTTKRGQGSPWQPAKGEQELGGTRWEQEAGLRGPSALPPTDTSWNVWYLNYYYFFFKASLMENYKLIG